MVRRCFISLLLLVLTSGLEESGARARESDVFARVRVSPRDVVVRQPFRVTISVHTSTWYTAPLRFSNLQIQGAFIIPFTRTRSSVEYFDRKQYASLTFYYLVIPYETGTLEIPGLEITATTPPEGDYKGVEVPVRTRPQKVMVKELPESEEDLWMVASNVSFRESWDKDLDQLKAGDVLERTIVLNAAGTLPSLIQPLEPAKPGGASLYGAHPELKDTRTAQDVNGSWTGRWSYLFEEEGEVVIPEERILWWNPVNKKVYSRTIAERILQIAPNPDLDMMISLKDSLDALQAGTLPVEEPEPFPWKRLMATLSVSLLVLYLLVRIILKLVRAARRRRTSYRSSSRYYLYLCRRALRKGDARAFVNALYTWADRRRYAGQSAALGASLAEKDRDFFSDFMEGMVSGEARPVEEHWKRRMPSLLKSLEKSL